MKRFTLLVAGVAAVAWLACAPQTLAAENEQGEGKGKEVTITGDGKCGKCALKETAKCQNVIEAEGKNGKKITYYLAENDLSKGFHKNLCQGTKKVTATGTVKKNGEKRELTVTKLELAKE